MTFCSHTTNQSPYIYPANGTHNYREITLALVGNVDISMVSPELYPNLLPYLDQYILKFQDRNDFSSVNRLKFCKEYINQYPERERIAKILTKRKSDPPPEPLPFNPEQLDAEIDKLLSLKKLNSSNANYSQKEIDQLIVEMRNRRLEAAEDEDFDLADRLALVSSKLTNQGAINLIRKMKIEQADELKQKLDEAKQTYNDLKERWCNLQANFKAETTKELDQMKAKQKSERIELEKKKDGIIPPKYRKHTQEYLNLKQEEKMLVTSKRFDEATIIQQRVREQKKYEDQLIQKEWIEIVDRELKKLTEKHKQQIRIREMNIKKEKNNIERTKKSELDALKNKITFLEKQISEREQFGAPPPEKPNKINDSSKASNREEEDKKSQASYYYSYYDSHETDEAISKLSIIKSENENKVFFTENSKAKVNEELMSEEEEFKDKIEKTADNEENKKDEDEEKRENEYIGEEEDNENDTKNENNEEDENDTKNEDNEDNENDTKNENNEEDENDTKSENNEEDENDENTKENENNEGIKNEINDHIKESEDNEIAQINENNENEIEDNRNIKENKNNENTQNNDQNNQLNENDEDIQDKENDKNAKENESDINYNCSKNSPNNGNIQENINDVNIHDNINVKNPEITNDKQNTVNEKDDQFSEEIPNSPKYVVHPPEDNDSQRNGYKNRNKKGYHISNNQNENDNQEQNNAQKRQKVKSSAYYANSTTSLPRLPISRKVRRNKKEPSGPEAFRQRALLNKQLYCGKTLLSQHIKNQKDQQKKKMKKKMEDEDSL